MSALIDLTGITFGRLYVVSQQLPKITKKVMWNCKCICGTEIVVAGNHLRERKIVSCKCYKHDVKLTHGDSYSRLYRIWVGMIRRCKLTTATDYHLYGKKGISVCSAWSEYPIFKIWAIDNGYSDSLTIDRINTHGNYEPCNCRWVSMTTQARNKSKRNGTSSKFIGVYFSKQAQKWLAEIMVNKKKIHIGTFKTEDDAGKARDEYIKLNNLQGFYLNETIKH